MAIQEIQGMPLLLIPKNNNELELLKSYHAHLVSQVSKMELHPFHKQDVQKLLTKSITIVTEHYVQPKELKRTGLYARICKKLFG
jgi:hypothetical protein